MVEPIRDIVIVGGGTAGWMTAASLSDVLGGGRYNIRLIESDEIATAGVGETTIPRIHEFHRRLGIDEAEFMRATNATFKLGTEFVDWTRVGDAYFHPFGRFGLSMNDVAFHHFWRAVRELGDDSPIADYCLASVAAKDGRFSFPQSDPNSIYASYSYAYHFDASLYAAFLRKYAERRGVVRCEGSIVEVSLDPESGNIASVRLDSGQAIVGDLFVDCSDFRAVLIGDALGTDFEDWSHWLPCDRAVAIPCQRNQDPEPCTRATALDAGWQWRIPLQHCTGNGHVYSSNYLSDDEAVSTLLAGVEGETIGEPRLLRFMSGKRRRTWVKNCVAIGPSAGFVEPLESTTIWLIQAAISQLVQTLPDAGFPAPDIAFYNRVIDRRFEHVRDFLIFHYHFVERNDTDFWRYCRSMPVPDSLAHRAEVFRKRGHVVFGSEDLFIESNWLAAFLGQNIIPESWDARVDQFSEDDLRRQLESMKAIVLTSAARMQRHSDFVAEYCQSESGYA